MHKHFTRAYTLALDVLMLILLLAAPTSTLDTPGQVDVKPDGPNENFKPNTPDLAATMIERRKHKRHI